MAPLVEKILREALELPGDARAELAAALLESIEEEPEAGDVAGAWSREGLRRLEEVLSGAVKPIPWERAREEIFGSSHDPENR